jgi:hypothetical protein
MLDMSRVVRKSFSERNERLLIVEGSLQEEEQGYGFVVWLEPVNSF